MVEEDSRSAEGRHLPRVLEALGEVRAEPKAAGFDLRAFSDSIILSGPLNPHGIVTMAELTATLQWRFLERRILIRGGIAFGKHYSDEHVLFSEALVAAYRVESELAKVPRVVVDHNLHEVFKTHPDTTEAMRIRMRELLLQDRDNRLFLNYLAVGNLASHADLITAYSHGTDLSREAVLEKVQWVVGYHNHMAALATPPEEPIDPVPLTIRST